MIFVVFNSLASGSKTSTLEKLKYAFMSSIRDPKSKLSRGLLDPRLSQRLSPIPFAPQPLSLEPLKAVRGARVLVRRERRVQPEQKGEEYGKGNCPYGHRDDMILHVQNLYSSGRPGRAYELAAPALA